MASYADGIGPWKPYIISTAAVDINGDGTVGDEDGDGLINEGDRKVLPPTDLVARAHARGLLVHPYTFRNEAKRLAFDYGDNPIKEYLRFYEAGVDGLFSDFAGHRLRGARAVLAAGRGLPRRGVASRDVGLKLARGGADVPWEGITV